MLKNDKTCNVAQAHYPLAIPFSPAGENSILSFQDKCYLEPGLQYQGILRVFRLNFYGLFKSFRKTWYFVQKKKATEMAAL